MNIRSSNLELPKSRVIEQIVTLRRREISSWKRRRYITESKILKYYFSFHGKKYPNNNVKIKKVLTWLTWNCFCWFKGKFLILLATPKNFPTRHHQTQKIHIFLSLIRAVGVCTNPTKMLSHPLTERDVVLRGMDGEWKVERKERKNHFWWFSCASASLTAHTVSGGGWKREIFPFTSCEPHPEKYIFIPRCRVFRNIKQRKCEKSSSHSREKLRLRRPSSRSIHER